MELMQYDLHENSIVVNDNMQFVLCNENSNSRSNSRKDHDSMQYEFPVQCIKYYEENNAAYINTIAASSKLYKD